jgi:haloalkane dehalogenase
VAAYRTPDERFRDLAGWPYQPRYVVQDGLRMHYVEEGEADPLLLLHGEPTWGFLYRHLVPVLAGVGRVVVPDLFGFGRSDKPVDPSAYSYDGHYASIERLALELDLRELTVVVHDWGGPIGLRFAVTHPDRVARLVLLNTGVGVGAPSEPWLRFRALVRDVGTELTASRLVQASCVTRLGDDAARGYDAPFPAAESKAGALAFPELVPTEPEHPSAAAMLEVRDALSRWEKPALVLFSDSDRVFSPADAERLAAHIPGALPAETVAGAGHFLQEDRGAEVAGRIARFVA